MTFGAGNRPTLRAVDVAPLRSATQLTPSIGRARHLAPFLFSSDVFTKEDKV